jgi:hypothetical protein
MENNQGNNIATPCLDQDVVVVLGSQHPLPRNPKKFLPKYDPDSNEPTDDHIEFFMIAFH